MNVGGARAVGCGDSREARSRRRGRGRAGAGGDPL